MNCKSCGKENAENAVFCKYCGKRVDGTKICPVCKNQIDEDSEFCIHCGARADGSDLQRSPVAQETVFTTVSHSAAIAWRPVAAKVAAIAVAAIALFTLVFVFFTGVQASASVSGSSATTGYDVFYFFGKGYKDYNKTIETFEKYNGTTQLTGYFKASQLMPLIFGTIISSAVLLVVFLLSVTAIVRTVNMLMGRKTEGGEKFALSAFAVYIFGIIALSAITSADVSAGGITASFKLNAATVAGVVLCSVAAFVWFGCKLIENGKTLLYGNNAIKAGLSVCCLILATIIAGLLTMPTINVINGSEGGVNALSLFSSVGIMGKTGESLKKIENAAGVAVLSVFSYIFLVLTAVCAVSGVINSIKNISAAETDKPPVKSFIWACAFALASMVFHIVTGNQFVEALGFVSSNNNAEISYGVPIAVFVLSFVAFAACIAQRIMANQPATAVAAAQGAAEMPATVEVTAEVPAEEKIEENAGADAEK